MLVSLGGGAGRSYTLHPYRFIVIITRVHFFNAESTNDLHKKALAKFDYRVGTSDGRGKVGEAML